MFAGAGPSRHGGPAEWEYVDPKGVVQGPFSSKDMLKWADAGFFTSDQQVILQPFQFDSARLIRKAPLPSSALLLKAPPPLLRKDRPGQCSWRWPYKLPPIF